MNAYLFDTNVVSEIRKPKPHGAVLQWVGSLSPSSIFVPAVVLYELQAGVEMTRRQDPTKAHKIEKWIDAMSRLDRVLPMDTECFRVCARMMDGKSGDLFADAMVAATASVHRLIVATRNIRDFRHFDVPTHNPFSTRR